MGTLFVEVVQPVDWLLPITHGMGIKVIQVYSESAKKYIQVSRKI
jgi:hypothetical protein